MKPIPRLMILTLCLALLIMSILTLLQERFIFLGVPLAAKHHFSFSVPYEEFLLETPGKGQISALRFPYQGEQLKGAIVYYHGNAGNLQRWGQIVAPFASLGFDVLIMDYRGYGKSRGPRSEELLYSDAWAFYQHITGELGYPEEALTVYGRSLGGSFATYVASKGNPGKLVLETPFYNLWDVVKSWFPMLPLQSIMRYTFPSNEFIKQVDCPITIYHGTRDRVVPHHSGYKLFKTAVSTDISFYSIHGGRHHDLSRFPGYTRTIEGVLSGRQIPVIQPEDTLAYEH